MNFQSIVIAIPLEEELLSPLIDWGKKFNFSEVKKIYLLHSVKKNIIPLEFGLMESPDQMTFREMEPSLKVYLNESAKKILPQNFKGELECQVHLDYHPEQAFVERLKELKADLVVVSTRGKHGLQGLFHSSFADYMLKFSPCDVLVVRPPKSVRF